MSRHRFSITFSALSFVVAIALVGRADEKAVTVNWPQWRGASGDGVVPDQPLPLSWSETSGLAWKCPLPEWGDSTPVVWGDAVFVTSQVEDRDLVLLKIARKTGQVEWTRTVGQAAATRAKETHKSGEDRGQTKFHLTQNLASPSPVTDGERVIAHFGNGDLAAYDFAGQLLWKRNLQQDEGSYSIWWGHANSPVLHGGLVISICLQDSCKDLGGKLIDSYVIAHDVRTGEVRWKTVRNTPAVGEPCDSYTTPILWQHGGRTEMLVMGGQMLDAYDPLSGKQLWSMPDLTGNRVIPSPVAGKDIVYVIQGMREPLVAIRPRGDGVRPQGDIVWTSEKGMSDSPSPVLAGDTLFMVNNDGILHAFDAAQGSLLWKHRIAGSYRASPFVSAGRVYLVNTTGCCTVVAASRRFEQLGENQLDDEIFASPVVSDGQILLRGRKTLYCVNRPGGK